MVIRTSLQIKGCTECAEFLQIRYGMSIWLLQENAGLTYREARVYLSHERNETEEQLAETFGIKLRTVRGLRRSASKKLEGKDLYDILMGYDPPLIETVRPAREPFF